MAFEKATILIKVIKDPDYYRICRTHLNLCFKGIHSIVNALTTELRHNEDAISAISKSHSLQRLVNYLPDTKDEIVSLFEYRLAEVCIMLGKPFEDVPLVKQLQELK